MDGSVAYKAYGWLGDSGAETSKGDQASDDLPLYQRLATKKQIEALLPGFVKEGVSIGDVPKTGIYKSLMKDSSVTGRSSDGCLVNKPGVHETMVPLRSNEYRAFGMPTLFFDTDAKLSDSTKAFLARYGVRPVTLNINEFGERKTVPAIDSSRKVLVAGDSVAFGTTIDDADTIASQLQQRDPARQYVTIAVPGAAASDVICGIEASLARYHGQIDGLVYVYSHTDFDNKAKYGRPEEVLSWMKEFVEREHIGDVTVVLTANMRSIAPQFTRAVVAPKFRPEQTRALRAGTLAAGYRFISVAELGRAEADLRKTDLAAFSLFMDAWGHLSPHGISRVVEKIKPSEPANEVVVRAKNF
jgi:hypothetical protein